MTELGDKVRAWAQAERARREGRASRNEEERKEFSAPFVDQSAFASTMLEVMRADSVWTEVSDDEALDAVCYIASRLGLILWLAISPISVRIALAKEIPHFFNARLAGGDKASQRVVREFWDGAILRSRNASNEDESLVMDEILAVVDDLLLHESQQSWQMSAIDALSIIRDAPAIQRLQHVARTPEFPDGVRAYARSVLEAI